MRIRLHGTPSENAAILTALARVLHIHHVSRSYPDRPPSTLARVYLTVTARSESEAEGVINRG